jgi:hypothetical protein
MAHAALHFSVGMVTGMGFLAPALRRAWQAGAPLARPARRWVMGGWALAFYAIVPSLLRYAGLPLTFTNGWWMNVFLFHPLLDRLVRQGYIAAGVLILGCFALQYGVVLACLREAEKKSLTEITEGTEK